MDMQKFEELMELMNKHEISEFSYEKSEDKEKYTLKKHSSAPQGIVQAMAPAPQAVSRPQVSVKETPTPQQTEDATGGLKLSGNQKAIRSPFVGTYYESPSPGSDPFVRVGQKIKKGDVLCIVEAMKLMNEIEAETDGIIVEVLVKNGQPVEYDQPIFIIE